MRGEHIPVLLEEVLDGLHIKSGRVYVDGTIGSGGHAVEIVKNGGFVIGIDRDIEMLEIARESLKQACLATDREVSGCFKLTHGDYSQIDEIVEEKVDGVLLDLGISQLHYSRSKRGFSFKSPEELLDMRLDTSVQEVRALDMLNALPYTQLVKLFSVSLNRREAPRLSEKITEERQRRPFKNVSDFVSLFSKKSGKVHPATSAFMALRIAVNNELGAIQSGLPKAYSLLKLGGVLGVIAFHSSEDRVVTRSLRKLGDFATILPSLEEISKNPSARSARLHLITKDENSKQKIKTAKGSNDYWA